MKILDFLSNLLSKTLGSWSLPYVDKKFDLKDYFEIEKKLRELNVPFAVGLVSTHGHGSNILIKFAQNVAKERSKTKVTHALAHIGLYDGYRHRVVEAIGEGLREVSLLQAIGQRDVVVIRVPNPKFLNDQVCKYAIEYLKDLADRDKEENIAYDNAHDYQNADTLDCSETIFQALDYAFSKADQASSIVMINRAGKKTWAPADIRHSDLFIDLYVTGKGFTNGTV